MSCKHLDHKQLSERFLSCKHWRWLPGMRCTHRWTGGIRVLVDENGEQSEGYVVLPDADGNAVMTIDECGIMGGFPEAQSAYPFLPDLTDPATLGCILALVRQAWADPGLSVWRDWRTGAWSWMALGQFHTVHVPGAPDGWDTELEAFLSALEAAR